MTKIIVKKDFYGAMPRKNTWCVLKINKIFETDGWEVEARTGHEILLTHINPSDVVCILKANNIQSKIVDSVVYPYYERR